MITARETNKGPISTCMEKNVSILTGIMFKHFTHTHTHKYITRMHISLYNHLAITNTVPLIRGPSWSPWIQRPAIVLSTLEVPFVVPLLVQKPVYLFCEGQLIRCFQIRQCRCDLVQHLLWDKMLISIYHLSRVERSRVSVKTS